MLFVYLIVAGLRRASSRLRLAALVLLTLWVAVPMTLTVLSFTSQGLAWQGRYALALAVGFPALAGLALSRAGRGPRAIHCVLAVSLCALAQTISIVGVAWTVGDEDLFLSFAHSGPAAIVLIAALARPARPRSCSPGGSHPPRRRPVPFRQLCRGGVT